MRKIHTTLPSLKVKKYALLTVLGCGSQMGYGQVSKGQFENMGGLNDYGLYHVSSLAAVLTDFPQLPDVMGILGMLVLLLGSGYKMYRYKVALKEAQKANVRY